MLLFHRYFSTNNNYTVESLCRITLIYNVYRLSTISDHFPQKCHEAITIIDKSKVALSDKENNKSLSIYKYRR